MKIYVLVAGLAILATSLVAGAGEFQSGDFVCRTIGTPVDAVEIAGYTGPDGAVTIPGVVEGLPVTGIGEAAFSGHWRISSVIIPDGVKTLGDRAFSWCSGLAFVSLPETLTSIGNQAFQVTSLLSVTLPNNLTDIGEEAFYACDLNTLSLPASVLRIGDRALRYCSGLSNITVAAENPAFKSEDGVLFDKSGCTLMVFPIKRFGEYGRGSYAIPAGTTHIAPSAFEGGWGLTNVLVPDTVTNIGEHAFSMCGQLQSIHFRGDAPSLPAGYYNTFARVKATAYQLPGTVGWDNWVLPAAPCVLPYPVILPTPSSLGIHSNGFGFKVSWATNASLVKEFGRTLEDDPDRTPDATNTLTSGWFRFTESEWTNHPSRLYSARAL